MKAVILEIKNGYAAALKDDGTVVKIKDENYNVGDVIRMKENKPLFNKKWGTLVAALLIFAMVGTGTWAYAEPFYFVGFDGTDEEITFEVNRLNRVIDVKFDESFTEGELEDLIDLDGMKIDEAILEVITTLGIKVDEDNFIITTAPKAEDQREEAERLASRIMRSLEDVAEEDYTADGEKAPKVEAIGAKMVEEAIDLEITPGKLNIINKLTPTDEDEIIVGEETYEREELISITQENPKDLMKIYSESRGNKNGVKFQEPVEDDEEEFDEADINKDGKVNGKDNAFGQTKIKTEDDLDTDSDETGETGKIKTNNGNKGGNGKGN